VASEQTIFIVEPDATVRASIAALAEVVRVKSQQHESAEDFLAAYARSQGGCLISAIQLPGMSGLDLMNAMIHDGVRLPTIIITAFADVRLAVRVMHAGAVTLLEKPYRNQELWEAIREALAVDSRIRQQEARLAHAQDQLSSLTRDEKRVLERILAGRTNKVIAQELSMRLRTVEARRHALMVKLQANSLAELIQTVTEARLMLSLPFARAASPLPRPSAFDDPARDSEPAT
jgi:FixJ family two-component response regulator